MANIRNQDSWVHSDDPAGATEKAKALIRMAVARVVTLKQLHDKKIPVNQRALVVGGGVAGMNAALNLANQGFETVLLEKEDRLGGLAKRLGTTIEGADISRYISSLSDKVLTHPDIQVLTRSLVVGFSGYKGNFTTEVLVGPGMYERKIEHGAVIVATGAHEYQPTEYFYGKDSRVLTQIELATRLSRQGADDLNQVVMIQCVGSRNEINPNCSRVCCQSAIKNALHIKEQNPETQVFILYRDIRTYGFLEDYYTAAREKGVLFFRFDPEDSPQVEPTEEGMRITFTDHVLRRKLQVDSDLLVLSAGVEAEDTEELSSILKLARNAQGFFVEAHVKLRPVDMATEGIFVCGTAHSPKLISESIAQALAAAARAATFLSKKELTLSSVTAQVEPEKCAACLVCVRSCPFGVPKINDEGVSQIDPALCQGCGVCTAECPAKAIELNWYEDDQILSKVEALLEGVL
jgi:heterodisulfide reductase subunit A-like polyferredoxin